MNAGEACAVAHFGDFVYSVGPVFFATTVHISGTMLLYDCCEKENDFVVKTRALHTHTDKHLI